jgi:tRNA 2-thiouridine synthesizing protein A
LVERLLYTQDVVGSNPAPPTTSFRRTLSFMSSGIHDVMVDVLDARGLYCPLPVVKTRQRFEKLPPEARLDVVADDPLARLDLKAFCLSEGHAYLGEREEPGGGWRMALRKSERPDRP